MCRETGGKLKKTFLKHITVQGNSTNDFLIPTKVQGNSGETHKYIFKA